MINLIDMILIVDNVISDDESKLLISEFETETPTKEASREVNSSEFVQTNADFIDLKPKTKIQQIANDKTSIMVGHYKDYIEKLGYFDTHGLTSNLEYAHKYRIIKYDIGQSFHDHVDKSPFIFGSCSLALNDDYEGGEYRFFRGHHKVKLKKGQGMIWPADYFFVHGVNTITKGCKYAVNSFLGIIQCVEMPKQSQDELNRLQTGIQQIHNETANAFKHKSSEKSTALFQRSTVNQDFNHNEIV
jgi:hypothetical protein